MLDFVFIQLAIDSSDKCEFTNILKNSVLGFMNFISWSFVDSILLLKT